jgi:hypothetical protein
MQRKRADIKRLLIAAGLLWIFTSALTIKTFHHHEERPAIAMSSKARTVDYCPICQFLFTPFQKADIVVLSVPAASECKHFSAYVYHVGIDITDLKTSRAPPAFC